MTKFGLQLFTAAALFAALAVQSAAAQSAGTADPGSRVHFGDIVDVDVVGSFEFDWRGGITPEGFLDGYDVIRDQVPAICRTEEEVAKFIADRLAEILREPNVRVRVVDRSKRPAAFISGAVRTGLRFQIKRPVELSELIALTGGITDAASGTISIFRPGRASCSTIAAAAVSGIEKASHVTESNGSQRFVIKIADLLKGDTAADPQIFTGDIITVLAADPIYMIGGVGNPGPITARESMTLTRAVATAGGLSRKADESNVTIYRRAGELAEMINADLRKIAAGDAEDIVLRSFDIIEIAEKGGGKRTFPPVVDRPDRNTPAADVPLRVID